VPDNRVSGDKVIGKRRLPSITAERGIQDSCHTLRQSNTYLGRSSPTEDEALGPHRDQGMPQAGPLGLRMMRYGCVRSIAGQRFYEAQHRRRQNQLLKRKAANQERNGLVRHLLMSQPASLITVAAVLTSIRQSG